MQLGYGGIVLCLSAGMVQAGTFESITSDLSMWCHSGSMNNQGHVVFLRGADDGGRFWYWDGQSAPYEIPDIASALCVATTPMKLNDKWMQNECGTCQGADLTGDHSVGLSDLMILIEHWLAKAE